MDTLTIIDAEHACTVAAHIDAASVRLTPTALRTALGWELKPEGLCRDQQCIPIAADPALVNDAGVNLVRLADILARPLVLDRDERVACVGTAAAERAAQLRSLAAPDFSLPDLAGKMHALSEHRGKKVLLVAYASW